MFNLAAQGVAISVTGNTPSSSAMLDVSSNEKGVLIPRMTEMERDVIVAPEHSLLIYQTDGISGFYFNAGTTLLPDWVALITAVNLYWSRNIVSGSLFPLTLTDDVGVGTDIPDAKLHIKGETSDNSTHAMKAEDSSGDILLGVRNDGEVSFKNYTFPIADGLPNQVLKTDGAGNLFWADAGSSVNLEAASVYMSANQSIGIAFTLVNFDTEKYDDNNNFDNTAGNYMYVCPSDGKYLEHIRFKGAQVGNGQWFISLRVNGADVAYSYSQATGVAGPINDATINLTEIFQLNQNDYIQVFARCTSGANNAQGTAGFSIFNVVKVE